MIGTRKTYFATALLATTLFLVSCDKDDDDPFTKSQYPGSGDYGDQVNLSSEDKNLLIGTYYLESWTSEQPKDGDGDGDSSTDLLTEFDGCYQDNALYIGTEIYKRTEKGQVCEGYEADEVIVQGEWFFGYDDTTYYALIVFKNEEGRTADRIQQMELFEFGGRKTMIGKVWDEQYESFDVVVYRTQGAD